MNQPRSPLAGSLLAVLGVSWLGQLTGCNGCVDYTPVHEAVGEAFTDDWGRWLSMAVTPSGQPAIASYDTTRTSLDFAVGTLADGAVTWEHQPVDGHVVDNADIGDRGQYASLAIGTDGMAWVSYYDGAAKVLRVAHKSAIASAVGPMGPYGDPLGTPSGSAWVTEVADSSSGAVPDAGLFTSLALDASGHPVVAHYDAGARALRVVHSDGETFTGELVDAGDDFTGEDTGDGKPETMEADVGKYANLLVADGTEYLAYYDAAAGDLKLATGTAGHYDIEVVDSVGNVGAWPDVLLGDDGTLTIAYQDVGNQDLKVATGRPGSWSIETVDEGPWTGADCAAFFLGDALNVLYFDGSHNNMKRAKKGGSWQTGTVAEDGALGFHSEVVLLGDVAYAASYDFTRHDIWFAALAD
jgi:hypothetical protein